MLALIIFFRSQERDGGEIISSDRLLNKEENSGVASGEEVQDTDNGNAEWPSELQREFTDVERQADIELTAELIERRLGKMPSWKSLDPHGLQWYRLTILISIKERIL